MADIKCRPDNLGAMLSAQLNSYGSDIQKELQAEFSKEGKSLKKEIAATSPVRTGKYKKGWKVTEEKGRLDSRVIVHNKVYQLPHLIERGRGPMHIAARPHIAKATDKTVRRLEKRIDDILGGW